MTNYALDAKAVSVLRRGVPVLRDLTFDVTGAAIVGLVGPSGCGKTTLMRSLAGVQQFTGALTVLGRPAGDPVLRHQIGYAPKPVPRTVTSPSRRTCATSAESSGRGG